MPLFRLRDRDILDYAALTASFLTLITRLYGVWYQHDTRASVGSLLLLALLSVFAVLELRELGHQPGWLTIPISVWGPLLFLAVCIAALTMSPTTFGGAVAGAVLSGGLLVWSSSLYKRVRGRPGIDQGSILAITVAAMAVGCERIGLFWLLWSLICTAYALITFFVKFLRTKSWGGFSRQPILVIPAFVFAVVLLHFPKTNEFFRYLDNSAVRPQLGVAEAFIADVKAGNPRIGNPAAITPALVQDMRLAYANETPRLVYAPLRSRANERFAFLDLSTSIVYVVANTKKTNTNNVQEVYKCTCICGF